MDNSLDNGKKRLAILKHFLVSWCRWNEALVLWFCRVWYNLGHVCCLQCHQYKYTISKQECWDILNALLEKVYYKLIWNNEADWNLLFHWLPAWQCFAPTTYHEMCQLMYISVNGKMLKNRKTCAILCLTIISLILMVVLIIAIILASQSQGRNWDMHCSFLNVFFKCWVSFGFISSFAVYAQVRALSESNYLNYFFMISTDEGATSPGMYSMICLFEPTDLNLGVMISSNSFRLL